MKILSICDLTKVSGGGVGIFDVDGFRVFSVTGDATYKINGSSRHTHKNKSFILRNMIFHSDRVETINGDLIASASSGDFCYDGISYKVYPITGGTAYLLFGNC